MHKHSISGLICWLLGVLVAGVLCLSYAFTDTYAQREDVDPVTAVTLWQFGEGRLLAGTLGTLPLIPLGTAPGGVATTYLYQAVNPVVVKTTNDDGFLSVVGTLASATYGKLLAPRTIIASASGWFEPFANEPTQTGHTIACSLVNSGFGDCIDITGASTVTSNSGLPTPVVLQVSSTVPPTVTPTSSIRLPVALTVPPTPVVLTGTPTPTSSAFSSASAPTSKPSARTGPIVGGVVGGLGVLGTIVALCAFWRRRRCKLGKLEDGITTTGASAPWSLDAATHIQVKGIDTKEHFAPQPLRAVPSWGKGSIGATQWSSDPDVWSSTPTDSYGEEYSEV
ncbi:hypothetical protein GGX14DRAFT_595155 [Mycena pura]|uniref:Transmembrane protein n=1 Tax=Mycena pura TaxID=153505 RepID=A0AAD6YFH6_9AGAR|nr:hypothetical protein GGX14DRAFT_595155 [Mycena pura]